MSRQAKAKPYKPNTVSRGGRVLNVLLGLMLLGYGIVGLLAAHVDLHGARIRIAVFEGGPAWLMAAAFIAGALVLFSVVIDHYDTRNNERYYKAFRLGAQYLGWCLVVSALIAHCYIGCTR